MSDEINIYPIKKGTLLIPTLPSRREHLFFICHDPVYIEEMRKDCFLIVNLTSIKPEIPYDNSCVLNVNDHSFIKHPSYISYRNAEIYGADNTISKIKSNEIRVSELCSDEVFAKVIDGFKISKHVKRHIKLHFDKYCI